MLIHSQTSWPYLISELLVAGSSWPRTFFTPQVFLFSIYVDLQKAFDKVPHARLLSKLNSYGIIGKLFHWIENFLSNIGGSACVCVVPNLAG